MFLYAMHHWYFELQTIGVKILRFPSSRFHMNMYSFSLLYKHLLKAHALQDGEAGQLRSLLCLFLT